MCQCNISHWLHGKWETIKQNIYLNGKSVQADNIEKCFQTCYTYAYHYIKYKGCPKWITGYGLIVVAHVEFLCVWGLLRCSGEWLWPPCKPQTSVGLHIDRLHSLWVWLEVAWNWPTACGRSGEAGLVLWLSVMWITVCELAKLKFLSHRFPLRLQGSTEYFLSVRTN